MIVPALNTPRVARRFRSSVVWMNTQPLEPGRNYFIKHTSHTVRASSAAFIIASTSTRSRTSKPAARTQRDRRDLRRNPPPALLRPYSANRSTGAFIVIDPLSNETLARHDHRRRGQRGDPRQVTAAERAARFGNRPA